MNLVEEVGRQGPGVALSITVLAPDGTETSVDLGEGSITVGRDESCDLVLDSEEISRTHATLSIRDEKVAITDSSSNGTVVAGQCIKATTITVDPNTSFQVGPFILRPTIHKQKATSSKGTREVSPVERRDIHRRLLEQLDLVRLDRSRMNDHLLRAKVRLALESIVAQVAPNLPVGTDLELLTQELMDEALGLGALENLVHEPGVSEIMVLDTKTVYVERDGKLELTDVRFTDEDALKAVLERIISPLGRRIDEASPLVDGRLPDGSRVNAVIRPLALRGTCITIRRFPERALTLDDLLRLGTLSPSMALFLMRAVKGRKNILISGGTGSGKTTLLNVLSGAIPSDERIITIEDAAELRLAQPHVVPLEARPPNLEGRGEISIRALVKNALRMRPDRIIVGETRGGEALDMLQAMNTGHDGSMTTTHANNPEEALKRLETLTLMSGIDLPAQAIREQIAHGMQLVVQQVRFSDGSRRITSIAEIVGLTDEGTFDVQEIFGFRRLGKDGDGRVIGEFVASGRLPTFLSDFIAQGLIAPGESFL